MIFSKNLLQLSVVYVSFIFCIASSVDEETYEECKIIFELKKNEIYSDVFCEQALKNINTSDNEEMKRFYDSIAFGKYLKTVVSLEFNEIPDLKRLPSKIMNSMISLTKVKFVRHPSNIVSLNWNEIKFENIVSFEIMDLQFKFRDLIYILKNGKNLRNLDLSRVDLLFDQQVYIFPNDLSVRLNKLRLYACRLNHETFKIINTFDIESLLIYQYPCNQFIDDEFSFGNIKRSLENLTLDSVSLTKKFFDSICELQLEMFVCNNEDLSFFNNTYDFGKLKNSLKTLELEKNKLTTQGVISITQLKLQKLSLSHIDENLFEGLVDFGNLNKTLKNLSLESFSLSRENCQIISKLKLTHLSLTLMYVSDFGLLLDSSKKKLKSLELKYCDLDYDSLDENLIINLALERISFSNNVGLEKIRLNLCPKKLKKLSLKFSFITDANLKWISKINLRELDISFCETYDLGDLPDFTILLRSLKLINITSAKLALALETEIRSWKTSKPDLKIIG